MSNKVTHDIFGPGSNTEARIFTDYQKLLDKIQSCRKLNLKIVLTSGGFDLFHVGHSRYLEIAKSHGDILIVGVDSDQKIKKRKGPHRPIVNEAERMEILCHSRYVDLVFLKKADQKKWQLVKKIQPDILITTEREYKKKDLDGLKRYCGKIVLLKSQATTSTTAKIRSILLETNNKIKDRLQSAVKDVCRFLDDLTKGGV